MSHADALTRYPLFALAGHSVMEAWAAEGRVAAFETGETLTRAGRRGESAYLVLDGRVRVVSHGESREIPLGVLGPGEVFGEYALLPPHLQTATCRAAEPGRLLRLPLATMRALFLRLLGNDGAVKRWLRLNALAVRLRGGAFLGFLSAPAILGLHEACVEERHPADCAIQAAGLADSDWFFLASGEAESSSRVGPPRPLRAGDTFGERALLGRGRLPTTVARTDAVVLRLPGEAFAPRDDESALQTYNPARRAASGVAEWTPQRGADDCGAAALAMAARALGLPGDLSESPVPTPGGRGTSIEALAARAEGMGLTARAVRLCPETLHRVRGPAVAHLREGHYVTLFACGHGGAVVGDPARGVLHLALGDFAARWSGAVLLLARREA